MIKGPYHIGMFSKPNKVIVLKGGEFAFRFDIHAQRAIDDIKQGKRNPSLKHCKLFIVFV